tara:strand:+ start:7169 stop:10768 length:3600 start_codon:yes stop_codon:yes gene_type:complete
MSYEFQILDISQDDVGLSWFNKEYIITLYGKTNIGLNIVCNIKGFEPYYYIKIPSSWPDSYKYIFLKNIDKNYKNIINTNKLIVRCYKDLYGYNVDEHGQVKKYSFLKLHFKNYMGFCKFRKNVIKYYEENINTSDTKIKQWIKCNSEECDSCLYESSISPIIKFIHDKKINPSGWVKINKSTDPEIINFKTELVIESRIIDIESINRDDINDFKIASFDIECDSQTGAFPLAIKDFRKPAQDILTIYYEMNKNYTEHSEKEKIVIIRNLLENVYSIKNDMDIHKIILKDEAKIEIDDFNILSEEFIKKIDKSMIDKKEREQVIKEIMEDFKSKHKVDPIKGDPIIQIGTVFYNYISKIFKRYLIVIGHNNDEQICSDIDGVIVIRCENENNLLLEWVKLINKEDPDFITGYNILGFDFKYINDRVKELCVNDFFDMGRLKATCEDYYFKKCKYIDKNKSWGKEEEGSTANAFNTTTMIEMDGRVIFDIQKEITKGHNLESYKLDNVSSHFMRGVIYKIVTLRVIEGTTNKRYIKLYTKNIRQLKINDYITLNTYSNVGEMLFMNGTKFIIETIEGNCIYINITLIKFNSKSLKEFEKVEWCLSKDDVPPSEIFNLHKTGGALGRAKVGKYCIQDCELCIHLLLTLDIIPNNIGMSNVCMVPLNFIFSRGQGIKVTSVVSKICAEKNTRMPTLKRIEGIDDGFEGAIVLDPTPGIYLEDPIVVLDFASLYPSCIIEYNCSHETQITSKDYINKLKHKGELETKCNIVKYDNYEYVKINDKSKTLKKIKNEKNPITTCYFAKSEREIDGTIKKESMGILPIVLDHLLSSRSRIKKMIKKEKDYDKVKVLDGLQLAYKVTANSVYGQLGSKTSTIFKKEIAACTTSIGRSHIYDAERGVIEWASKEKLNKPEIIYGDTDSVFVKFSRIDYNGNLLKGLDALTFSIKCGINAGEYITNNILQKPQDLEYEKTFYPFVLISKKRYIGDKYETIQDVQTNNYKRTSMGIVMKRRDNAPIVKYVFGNIIEKLLVDRDYENAIIWLEKTLKDIKDGFFDGKYFIISKSLNDYYKNPESIAHKVLADRITQRDPGNKPLVNERIQYMYIKIQECEFNGYEKIKKRVPDGFYKNKKIKYKTIVENGKSKYKKKKINPGDRIETPLYILDNKLDLDYSHYISNQIMKPVEQVLELHCNYKEGIFNKFIN